MGTTPKGIPYPDSDDHTRLWEHLQALAEGVDGVIGPVVRRGRSTVNTNADGFATITHGLGVVPTVILTNGVTSTINWIVPIDATATTFRVCVRSVVSGAVITNTQVQVAWQASVASS